MRAANGSHCMPWMVGLTLIQTILLVGIVTKVALVAVRWEHDHTGSHRSFHSSMLRQEFEGDLEGDSNSNAGLNDDAYDLTEGGAGGNGTGNASEAVHHQRGHARHRLGRGGGLPLGRRGSNDPRIFHEEISTWPYTCWTPKSGMSTPRLTMVTVIDGLPKAYQKAIWDNRMQYAAKHGYRYCEMQMHDRNKIPAFAKLPWILALAPCTDFVIHLDADAQMANLQNSFLPWIQFMNSKNVDQLFSADIIHQSPINYGVFMIRTAPWLWSFYKKIYNMCACDWSRMHDWPAEQGIVYDLIAGALDSYETGRSLIVPNKGWNHILDQPDQKPEPWDVVMHLTYPRSFPKDNQCYDQKYRDEHERACKYLGLEYFLTNTIGTSQHDAKLNVTEFFVQEENSCQQVRQNSLVVAKTTYSNQHDALPGSAMDFDLDPHTGQVTNVKVSEIACLGYREKQCSLKRYWDVDKGVGPWEVYRQDIV